MRLQVRKKLGKRRAQPVFLSQKGFVNGGRIRNVPGTIGNTVKTSLNALGAVVAGQPVLFAHAPKQLLKPFAGMLQVLAHTVVRFFGKAVQGSLVFKKAGIGSQEIVVRNIQKNGGKTTGTFAKESVGFVVNGMVIGKIVDFAVQVYALANVFGQFG